MIHIVKLRIRMFFSKKIMLLLFVVFPLLFSFISLNYLKADDFEIKTTIGIIDADQTDFSKNIIERLQSDESLMVFVLDEDSGKEALIREAIIGLYIIKDGFSQAVKTGNTHRIIEVRYLADNYTAPGITDLITPHFIFDILKEQTILTVNRAAFPNNPDMSMQFRNRFLEHTILYENSEELELQVMLNSIESDAGEPLFSTSKEIIIRYFLSILLIFLIITGFYQAIQINVDKEHGIIGRVKLSRCPYHQYVLGNIAGIALIVFVISAMQILLLKSMLFYHLELSKIVPSLAVYSLSISLLSLVAMSIFKKGSDFQTAIPYLIIAIWISGGWIYSETVIKSDMLRFVGRLPGMLIKDDLIIQSTDIGQQISMNHIAWELGFQMIMFLFVYIKGKSRYERHVD